MQTRIRAAIVLLLLATLAGVWLFVAPFLLGYQPAGADWVTATTNHVATAAVLVATGLAAVLVTIGTALRALAWTAPDAPSGQAAEVADG